MNRLKRQLSRKLNNNHGFSLTELLATIAIMSIILGVVAGGAAALIKVYKNIRLRADAQSLLSTTVMAVSEGMYTATDVKTSEDGTVTGFTSEKLGDIYYSIGSETNTETTKTVYYIKVSSKEDGTDGKNIVANKTQTLDLSVAFKDADGNDTSPKYNADTHVFTYTITVSDESVKETQEVQVHSIVDVPAEETDGE